MKFETPVGPTPPLELLLSPPLGHRLVERRVEVPVTPTMSFVISRCSFDDRVTTLGEGERLVVSLGARPPRWS